MSEKKSPQDVERQIEREAHSQRGDRGRRQQAELDERQSKALPSDENPVESII